MAGTGRRAGKHEREKKNKNKSNQQSYFGSISVYMSISNYNDESTINKYVNN